MRFKVFQGVESLHNLGAERGVEVKHIYSIFLNSVIVVKSGHLEVFFGVTDPSVAKTEIFNRCIKNMLQYK